MVSNIWIVVFLFFASLCFSENREVRLGYTIPLTGNFASYGKAIQDGARFAKQKLAVDKINAKLIFEDVPLPDASAITAIKKLINIYNIDGLAGNFFNPAIPVMAPIINKTLLPAFHTAIADDFILNAGNSIFSTNAKVKAEASLLANYAKDQLQAKTASIFFVTTNWGDSYAKNFKSIFESKGGKITNVDTANVGIFDFKDIILRTKNKNPDVIFLAFFGPQLGTLIKQFREAGISTKILSTYEADDNSVRESAGEQLKGVEFFVPDSVSNYSADLMKEFRSIYGYEATVLTKNAFDATTILAKTLIQCRYNKECTNQSVAKLNGYHGFSGDFSIDEEGATAKEFLLRKY